MEVGWTQRRSSMMQWTGGDGGNPGIKLIEPGSTTPSTGTLVFSQPTTVTFSASALSPVGGPASQVSWLINNSIVAGVSGPQYTATISAKGTTTVTVRVHDATALVNPAMAGGLLDDAYTWTVQVASVPGAPTGVTATPEDGGAGITWSAPVDDGGSPVTAYLATADPGGRTCSPDPATATACTMVGLQNGQAYTFTVTAANAVGTGPASAPSTAVTPHRPPVASMAALAATTLSPSVALSWQAVSAESLVESYDVRYRRAPWNGAFGGLTTWRSGTSLTTAAFAVAPGYTYCYGVRATDVDGIRSGWTLETCSATPIHDRRLTRSTGWVLGTGTAYYLRTNVHTTRHGATLTRKGVKGRQVTIVAKTCTGCGSVAVYWNGARIRTVSLASTTTRYRKVITVLSFSEVRTGTLKLVVRSSGRRVVVDGIGVSRN